MSELTHHQLPLSPTRIRALLVAGAIALVIAAAAIAAAIGGSQGGSTVAAENVSQAPALRADGGPEESTRGPINRSGGATEGAALRSDGGPEESTRGPIGGR